MVAGAGPQGSSEEYEHFIEVRRHVKRMQSGTPLLLRTGANAAAKEDLRICTFWVTQDLQSLRWREQEGDGPGSEAPGEVPLSAIASVSEDASRNGDEDHHALTLVLRPGASKQISGSMGLICASTEDLATWRQGLKFLVGSLPPPQPPRGGAATGAAAASTGEQAQEPEGEENLRETLREQLEVNEKLRKENDLLREVVKRKEETIAMLHRDLQRGAVIGESSGKTESTSRESDEHLSYREAAILRRKNRRLQKAVREKQKTVSDLLSIIGRVSSQQGAESSAVEDDEDEEASDGTQSTAVLIPGGGGRRASGRRSGSLADVGEGPSGDSAGGRRASGRRSGSLADVGEGPSGDSAGGGGRGQGAGQRGCATTGSSETEDVREELAALAGKRERLAGAARSPAARAQDTTGPSLAAAPPSPSPPALRSPAAAKPRQEGGGGAAEQLLQMAAAIGSAGASAGASPLAGSAAGPLRSPAAAASAPPGAGPGMGSALALEALAQEMQKLEEKKRAVERLARRLEPPSDGEEDDGFPLR